MIQEHKQIGPYRLVEVLGAGGMGTVFKAFDERLQRPCAIKVIRHDRMSGRPATMERLVQEARVTAAVNHPYLVQLYELVEWEDGYGVVMELVEGANLASQIKDGPLEVQAAVRVLSEITEGLAAIHDRGILHRDLKSENVMITPHGHVKIMDFGLASVSGPVLSAAEHTILGTPRTMSPETIRGGSVDTRSDLFALGVLAYELLTGVQPFQGPSLSSLLKSILHEPHVPVRELRPEVPSELADLVDRLLEKKPANRPGHARDVLAVLDELPPGRSSVKLSSSVLGTAKSQVPDPWTDSTGTASVTWAGDMASVVLEPHAGLSWASLLQWIRLAYYRFRPTAAFRRHAVLVDKSFQEALSPEDERELVALEALLDRLEKPRMGAIHETLLHLRDELKARKAGH